MNSRQRPGRLRGMKKFAAGPVRFVGEYLGDLYTLKFQQIAWTAPLLFMARYLDGSLVCGLDRNPIG